MNEWTDAKNSRRCDLVDKEVEGTISDTERIELESLQAEMLTYRQQVAPLELDAVRALWEELKGKKFP